MQLQQTLEVGRRNSFYVPLNLKILLQFKDFKGKVNFFFPGLSRGENEHEPSSSNVLGSAEIQSVEWPQEVTGEVIKKKQTKLCGLENFYIPVKETYVRQFYLLGTNKITTAPSTFLPAVFCYTSACWLIIQCMIVFQVINLQIIIY